MARNWTKLFEWKNEGLEPSETLKNNGFAGGYKPPASIFNRFFNRTKTCFDELQKVAEEHDTAIENRLPLNGGTMKGAINMGNKKITAVATPTESTDAVPKGYADEARINQTKKGAAIIIADSANLPFVGMSIYGKSTQDGTPTPDNPIDIESVGEGGDISVSIYGKNLSPINEVTVTNHQNYKLEKPLPKGQYIFTANVVSNDTDSEYSTVVFQNNGANVAYIPLKRGNVKYTFVAQIPITNIDFCASYNYSQGENDVATWSNIQLEYGDTETEFEQSKTGQHISIFTENGLRGIPVSSGGNYTDENGQQWICDEIDFARGVYIQRCYTYRAETIANLGTTANNRASVNLPYSGLPYNKNSALCSHFEYKPTVYSDSGDDVGFVISNKTLFFRFGSSSEINSTTLAQDWIENQASNGAPLTVHYILETPIETPLSATELTAYAQLVTNKPNTTVLNDSGADMFVEYYTSRNENCAKQMCNFVEDISSDFVVGISEGMSANAVKVLKQGNVISGTMQLCINADGAGDVPCYITINDKYKPAFSVPCPMYGSSLASLQGYISISGNKIDYGETNSTEGSAVISFSYICQ